MQRSFCVSLLLSASVFAADLPVRQVVLYKHGVGYFERAGQLSPGESARLEFKASEMNDVLKSLTLEEQGGGKVSGVRYDSSEPLSQRLGEFPFQIGNGQPLSAVLDQLKGARVELKFSDTVAGAIVGARIVPADDKHPEREQITLLLDSGDLRNFDLAAATSLRFADPKLQLQFKDYLTTLTSARSKEKRSVYIDSTDTRARSLLASYLIPTAIWKSSYRLVFGESGQPTLEGWAIVDNTTGEDWTNVQLSLVSGKPISFVSRLYEPRYIRRPTAELPEDQAQAPVVHEGAVELESDAVRMRPSAGLMAPEKFAVSTGVAGGVIGGIAGSIPSAAPPSPRSPWFQSTIASTASGREFGDLFEYRMAAPVTVRKSESAMLPFLQQKIETRKLLIYSGENSAHPTNAAEITNTTGKTLDGGPITVYDGGYAGEALMETLKAGDKRLISYAVDLGTRITTQFDSKGALVREIHASRGLLTTRKAQVETRTYTIRNVDAKAKTLVVEHPARPGYTLLDRKPTEKTTQAYRFEVKLAPGATEKFPVTEERVYEDSVAVANLTPDLIYTYLSNKELTEAGRRQLEQIRNAKEQVAAAERDKRHAESQIGDLVRDQDRIRKNIGSLNAVSGQQQQVQTYAKQLAAQETQLASLRDRSAELDRKLSALRQELDKLIANLSF
jgi:hypothetical protein